MEPTMQTPLIALSERAYRILLMLYPAEHRREYGPPMAQVFRDMCRDAYRQGGAWGVMGSWLPVLLDLAITAFEEHRKEEMRMAKETLVRGSGPVLIAAGVMLAFSSFSQLQLGSHYQFTGLYMLAFMTFVPALILVSLGLAGVRARYADRTNGLGRLGLMLAIAVAPISAIGFLGMVVSEVMWGVFWFGLNLHLLGMVLFGITAVMTKPLPRWNGLPILIGLLPFAMYLNPNDGEAFGPQYLAFGVILLFGLCYALLGYIVYAGTSRREQATA